MCPKGPGDPSYAVLDGVELYKYRAYTSGGGKASFVVEYLYSFVSTFASPSRRLGLGVFGHPELQPARHLLADRALVPLRPRISVRLRPSRSLPGDLRIALSRGQPGDPQEHCCSLERRTTRCADQVISTNDSYRAIAHRTPRVDPERVTVVRTGPDPERLKPVEPDPAFGGSAAPGGLHRGDGPPGRGGHRPRGRE